MKYATLGQRPTYNIRLLGQILLLSASGFFGLNAQAVLDLPDTPIFINSAGVPPNLILTLDDSGSMTRGYTPDFCGDSYLGCDDLHNRWAKSANLNRMYYDPTAVYPPPVNAAGTKLTTSFTAAYDNGFNTSSGTVDLSKSYQPTAWLWPGGSGAYSESSLGAMDMKHYRQDSSNRDVRCNTSGWSGTCQYTDGSTWFNTPVSKSCSSDTTCQTWGIPAYYYVHNGSAACSATNSSCYNIRIVGNQNGPADVDGNGVINADDEKQNFANWYSFYRTRNLATVSASSLSFATLPPETRVAWQAINSCRASLNSNTASAPAFSDFVVSTCRGWDTSVSSVSNAIKPFSGTYKTNFYNWLQRLPAYGGTALRSAAIRAGRYFSTSGDNSPYDNDLTVAGQGSHPFAEYSCRKNYQIIMTDGRWNQGNNDEIDNVGIGNLDGSLVSPFKDTNNNSNTISDIAYKYWSTDLRTGLTNNVAPDIVNRNNCPKDTSKENYATSCANLYNDAKNDPQYQQHMVNFTVGFGLSEFLALATSNNLTYDSDAAEPTFAGSYASLVNGTKTWPSTSSSGQGGDGNVADLWHAALNSRGKFYSADSPDKLVNAFQDIVNTITSTAKKGGGASLVGSATAFKANASGNASLTSYQAINQEDWSGIFIARQLYDDTTLGTTYWHAETRVPDHDQRNIFTYSGSSARAFTSCDSALQSVLGTGTTCTEKLNWLRGDHSKEIRYKTTNAGYLRDRKWGLSKAELDDAANASIYPSSYKTRCKKQTDGTTYSSGDPSDTQYYCDWVLGDIVNSNPSYVYGEDYGYAGGSVVLDSSTSTNDAIKAAYQTYVKTTKIARTPAVYVGANDGMMHAFQADDQATDSGKELFAYIPRGVYANLNTLTDPNYGHKFYVNGPPAVSDAYIGGAWKTYLVSGLGAGGKSVYALNISNPSTFSATNVAWEYNATGTDSDLGYVFSRPQIAPLKNGKWGAIFANGYNSGSDRAYLYIVDLETGSLLKKIAAGTDTSNGLATPYLYDSDGDKVVDYVYAGDLKGNLWKFDLTDSNASNWDIAKDGSNNKVALFTARNASSQIQPITSQPKVAPHPTNGVMVYFGTGKYLEVTDPNNAQVQSFYGIWDKPGATGTLTRSGTNLYQQAITVVTSGIDTWRTIAPVSASPIDWATQRGWFVDLPAYERALNPPLVIDVKPDKYDRILFTTDAPEKDPCKTGGESWLMQLSLLDGGVPAIDVFDVSKDSQFNSSDRLGGQIAVAKKLRVGISSEMLSLYDPKGKYIIVIGGSDVGSTDLDKNGDGTIDASEQAADRDGDGTIDAEPIVTPGPSSEAPVRIYWQQLL